MLERIILIQNSRNFEVFNYECQYYYSSGLVVFLYFFFASIQLKLFTIYRIQKK